MITIIIIIIAMIITMIITIIIGIVIIIVIVIIIITKEVDVLFKHLSFLAISRNCFFAFFGREGKEKRKEGEMERQN